MPAVPAVPGGGAGGVGCTGDGLPCGARRVGLSARHLRRLFLRHLGASPDQLARSRRAHFARRLLDDTDLTIVDVAFASGFGSLRQFNRTMREVFRAAPSDLRGRRRRADRLVADGGLALRLPVLPGYDWAAMRDLLAVWAIPGVESVEDDTYRRTFVMDGAPGLLEISSGGAEYLLLQVHLPYWEGLIHVVERVERLLGLDLDHSAGVAALALDPVLGPVVRKRPGLAVPGAWNAFEAHARAVLSGAELEELVRGHGTPVPGLPGGLTHTLPEAVAGLPEVEPERLAFRLGQRDAFPHGDPGIVAVLRELGLEAADAERWRPWLALAAVQLLAHGNTVRA